MPTGLGGIAQLRYIQYIGSKSIYVTGPNVCRPDIDYVCTCMPAHIQGLGIFKI